MLKLLFLLCGTTKLLACAELFGKPSNSTDTTLINFINKHTQQTDGVQLKDDALLIRYTGTYCNAHRTTYVCDKSCHGEPSKYLTWMVCFKLKHFLYCHNFRLVASTNLTNLLLIFFSANACNDGSYLGTTYGDAEICKDLDSMSLNASSLRCYTKNVIF
jgi:hypothetical protein